MSISRRNLVVGSAATLASASAVGTAFHFAGRYGLIPPDHTGILGVVKSLTYASQRLLTSSQALAREFTRDKISKIHPVNGLPPELDMYRDFAASGFQDWRLEIDGLVERPMSFSLAELKSMPTETHITLHACEEGWSYIAEWIGVRYRDLPRGGGIAPLRDVDGKLVSDPLLRSITDLPDNWRPVRTSY